MTSKDIWNKYPDKTSYDWLNRGVYTYNVMLKHENGELKKKKKKKKK